MSFNGSGTFLINTAGQPVVSGTVISSTAFNALTADLATGLSTAITKDGQTTVTANIPMSTYKFTGLGVGSAATDSANLSQVQSTVTKLLTSVSGTDTITAVGAPVVSAYAAGQMFYFVATGDNTGAVTLNIDSLGAKAVTRDGSVALAAGDIKSGEVVVVVYDGTRFQVVSQLNSAGDARFANVSITSALNVGGVATFSAGTAAAPSITTTGDTNTGIFFPAADTIGFTEGGVESMRIDSSGNVGIGTTSPLRRLAIAGDAQVYNTAADGASNTVIGRLTSQVRNYGTNIATASFASIEFATGTWPTGNIRFLTNGTDGTDGAGTERMRLDSSGNLGLGVTPSAWGSGLKALQVGANSYASLFDFNNGVSALSSNLFWTGSAYSRISASSRWSFAYFQDTTNGAHSWLTSTAAGTSTPTMSTLMTLDASGNLGIGTSSPGAPLNVKKNSAGAVVEMLRLTNDGPGAGSMSKITFDASGTAYAAITGGYGASGPQIKFELPTSTGGSWDWIYQSTTLATLLTSGNLGIGTSSPLGKLQIKTQTNGNAAFVNSTSVSGGVKINCFNDAGSASSPFELDGSTLQFNIGAVEKMRLDSSGNLGIGTTTIGSRVTIGDPGTGLSFTNATATSGFNIGLLAGTGSAQAYVFSRDNAALLFGTNNTERARITSGGDLLVGTTTNSPGAKFGVLSANSGNGIFVTNTSGTSSYNAMAFYNNGTSFSNTGAIVVSGSTTAYNTSSDRRLKDNIAPADNAGSVIDAIEIVKHDWKSGGHVRFGMIAQDLHQVAPEAVSAGDDGEEIEKTWGVDYSKLVPMLVKEIQSLRARVAQLESK